MLDMDLDRKEKEKELADTQRQKGHIDDYDAQIRAMMFDKRAAPTNRVRTEEEIAKEKAEEMEARLVLISLARFVFFSLFFFFFPFLK